MISRPLYQNEFVFSKMAETQKKDSAGNQFGPYDWKIREAEARERAKRMKEDKRTK
jgi:hypothetical protein